MSVIIHVFKLIYPDGSTVFLYQTSDDFVPTTNTVRQILEDVADSIHHYHKGDVYISFKPLYDICILQNGKLNQTRKLSKNEKAEFLKHLNKPQESSPEIRT